MWLIHPTLNGGHYWFTKNIILIKYIPFYIVWTYIVYVFCLPLSFFVSTGALSNTWVKCALTDMLTDHWPKSQEIVMMDVMMECAIVIIYNIVCECLLFLFLSIWISIHFYIECSFYCSHPIKYCSFEWNKCNGQNTFSRYITCQCKSKHYIFMKVHEIFFVNSIETYTFEI